MMLRWPLHIGVYVLLGIFQVFPPNRVTSVVTCSTILDFTLEIDMSFAHVLLCINILGLVTACATPATELYPAHRLSDADVAERRASGTSVDTIVVTPDHFTLHVGERVLLWDAMPSYALDANRVPIASFKATYVVPSSTVFRMDGPNVLALTPGEGIIYVEALPRTTQARTRPSTAVRVIVVP